MSAPLRWRYRQILPDGSLWTSEAVFDGELRHAAQGVIAGSLFGQPRAAIEERSGRVLFALDRYGLNTEQASALFRPSANELHADPGGETVSSRSPRPA